MFKRYFYNYLLVVAGLLLAKVNLFQIEINDDCILHCDMVKIHYDCTFLNFILLFLSLHIFIQFLFSGESDTIYPAKSNLEVYKTVKYINL